MSENPTRVWFPQSTLEGRQLRDLEHIEITCSLISFGREQATVERLEWMKALLEDAIDAQQKIDKRDARKARKAAQGAVGS